MIEAGTVVLILADAILLDVSKEKGVLTGSEMCSCLLYKIVSSML